MEPLTSLSCTTYVRNVYQLFLFIYVISRGRHIWGAMFTGEKHAEEMETDLLLQDTQANFSTEKLKKNFKNIKTKFLM